jgi:hypothetical protein
MAKYLAPGAAFTSRVSLGPAKTGLAGTARFRLLDNDATANDPVYGPSTANIIEDPSGSGDYVFNGTLPVTAGPYSPAWDDGTATTDLFYDEDIIVTSSTTLAPSSTSLYVTRAEVKATLDLSDNTYADDDIDEACSAASRAIDHLTGRRFYQATETRYYTVDPYTTYVEIQDAQSVSAVTIDTDGNGSYETTWIEGIDFYLDPPNAVADLRLFTRLSLRSQAGRRFPGYARAVKVDGTFGPAETPVEVRQFAKILAIKLLVRSRQAPFGFQAVGGDLGAVARLARTDPDFQVLLGGWVRTPLFV